MSTSTQHGATARQITTFLAALLAMCTLGGVLMAGVALPLATTTATTINAVTGVFEDVPNDLGFTEPSEQSVLLASDGSVLARIYAENRIVVSSEQISDHMKNAVVSIEDHRFYQHHGIDVQGLAGAFINNVTGGATAGGSSITQQYVKNALIEQGRVEGDNRLIDSATEQTISRKINEARYAIAIEKTMTKDQILTGYLNLAQFGTSEYGVETAALHYFSKHAADLNIAESALLAGMTQSPARWDPINHPDAAKTRRDVVLGEMNRYGYITDEELQEAIDTPIADMLNVSETTNGCAAAGNSAYFCRYVIRDLLADDSWGTDADDRLEKLYRGGLTIQTTLDPAKQQAAFDTLVANIPTNDASGIQMALSSVEPGTGHIVAMAQNTNYGEPSESDLTATTVNLNVNLEMGGGYGFQSGSTFKIFTLIQWLKEGHTAYEYVNSNQGTIPRSAWTISCSPESADAWPVSNLEGHGGGQMTVLQSTRESVNGSFAHMAEQMDLCDIAQNALDMGVERGDGGDWQYNPSSVLGTNEITPLSMAVAVATLADDGNKCDPISYTQILGADGEVLLDKKPTCRQVLDTETARKTNAVLKQVVTSGATGENAIVPGREVAGKTGTANSDMAAWFVGYTPQLATAIWQGHQSGSISMLGSVINGRYYWEVYGGLFPATVFSQYMTQALADEPAESFPAPSSNVITSPNTRRTPSSTAPSTQSEPEEDAEGGDEEDDTSEGGDVEPAQPDQPEPDDGGGDGDG